MGCPQAPGRALGAVRRRHPRQSAPRGHVGAPSATASWGWSESVSEMPWRVQTFWRPCSRTGKRLLAISAVERSRALPGRGARRGRVSPCRPVPGQLPVLDRLPGQPRYAATLASASKWARQLDTGKRASRGHADQGQRRCPGLRLPRRPGHGAGRSAAAPASRVASAQWPAAPGITSQAAARLRSSFLAVSRPGCCRWSGRRSRSRRSRRTSRRRRTGRCCERASRPGEQVSVGGCQRLFELHQLFRVTGMVMVNSVVPWLFR